MKPLIGITAGTIYNRDRPAAPATHGQLYEYSNAIVRAGGVPLIIPIAINEQQTREVFERLDGFLFAGGNDIAPHNYGKEIRYAKEIDEPRDRHEIDLMRLALESHKPILAICRGMQLLNVVHGGTLYQDIAKEVPSASNHKGYRNGNGHDYLEHMLMIEAGSSLADIIGGLAIRANSRHHQAIRDLGHGLLVNARSEDGIIEGVESMDGSFVIGVQAHPEALAEKRIPAWQFLFDAFVAAAQKM